MSENNIPKEEEYAKKIMTALCNVFNPEAPFFIDQEELKSDQNLTHFAHALTNMVPTKLLNDMTGSDKSLLEANHTANIFCFQYGEMARVDVTETEAKEEVVTKD